MKSLQTRTVLVATLIAMTAGTALAPTSSPALSACSQETDAAKRLACFDRASGAGSPPAAVAPAAVAPAVTAPAVTAPAVSAPADATPAAVAPVVAPAAAAATPPADTFGLSEAKEDKKKEKEQSVEARVASVERGPRGLMVMTLDNGQVWQQSDPKAIGIKPGASVKITRLLFGSYWARISGTEGTSVKRLR